MAKMESMTGEMEVQMLDSGSEKGNLTITGKVGLPNTMSLPVWTGLKHVEMDFKFHFSPQEIWHLMPLIFKPAVIGFILSVPFRLLGSKSEGKKN